MIKGDFCKGFCAVTIIARKSRDVERMKCFLILFNIEAIKTKLTNIEGIASQDSNNCYTKLEKTRERNVCEEYKICLKSCCQDEAEKNIILIKRFNKQKE